ncbi:Basic proline-rich protein precursor [Vulgatibacter incomptus]|uniref:Basic proline-rich protein n=1 Tax=Vulgatibacter incomptus TaxID=1391653 RepID=A0A0K1PHI5_9BACT|nr:Basic proline-rich protein precursor [Vulgatibacter incomptus]
MPLRSTWNVGARRFASGKLEESGRVGGFRVPLDRTIERRRAGFLLPAPPVSESPNPPRETRSSGPLIGFPWQKESLTAREPGRIALVAPRLQTHCFHEATRGAGGLPLGKGARSARSLAVDAEVLLPRPWRALRERRRRMRPALPAPRRGGLRRWDRREPSTGPDLAPGGRTSGPHPVLQRAVPDSVPSSAGGSVGRRGSRLRRSLKRRGPSLPFARPLALRFPGNPGYTPDPAAPGRSSALNRAHCPRCPTPTASLGEGVRPVGPLQPRGLGTAFSDVAGRPSAGFQHSARNPHQGPVEPSRLDPKVPAPLGSGNLSGRAATSRRPPARRSAGCLRALGLRRDPLLRPDSLGDTVPLGASRRRFEGQSERPVSDTSSPDDRHSDSTNPRCGGRRPVELALPTLARSRGPRSQSRSPANAFDDPSVGGFHVERSPSERMGSRNPRARSREAIPSKSPTPPSSTEQDRSSLSSNSERQDLPAPCPWFEGPQISTRTDPASTNWPPLSPAGYRNAGYESGSSALEGNPIRFESRGSNRTPIVTAGACFELPMRTLGSTRARPTSLRVGLATGRALWPPPGQGRRVSTQLRAWGRSDTTASPSTRALPTLPVSGTPGLLQHPLRSVAESFGSRSTEMRACRRTSGFATRGPLKPADLRGLVLPRRTNAETFRTGGGGESEGLRCRSASVQARPVGVESIRALHSGRSAGSRGSRWTDAIVDPRAVTLPRRVPPPCTIPLDVGPPCRMAAVAVRSPFKPPPPAARRARPRKAHPDSSGAHGLRDSPNSVP